MTTVAPRTLAADAVHALVVAVRPAVFNVCIMVLSLGLGAQRTL
jgi:hypothetical protein